VRESGVEREREAKRDLTSFKAVGKEKESKKIGPLCRERGERDLT
jgi:hypothetical protein